MTQDEIDREWDEAARLFNEHFARANALLQECAPKPLVDDPKEAAAIADLVTRILFK